VVVIRSEPIYPLAKAFEMVAWRIFAVDRLSGGEYDLPGPDNQATIKGRLKHADFTWVAFTYVAQFELLAVIGGTHGGGRVDLWSELSVVYRQSCSSYGIGERFEWLSLAGPDGRDYPLSVLAVRLVPYLGALSPQLTGQAR